MLCLAVVRELFNNDSKHYFNEISRFWEKENVPCLLLYYAELHMYTIFCKNEDEFVKQYHQTHEKIINEKMFFRRVFGINDIPS